MLDADAPPCRSQYRRCSEEEQIESVRPAPPAWRLPFDEAGGELASAIGGEDAQDAVNIRIHERRGDRAGRHWQEPPVANRIGDQYDPTEEEPSMAIGPHQRDGGQRPHKTARLQNCEEQRNAEEA